MMLTENQEQLVYWICERESIRLAKEEGCLAPWSDNKVMQETYFCNVNREDDNVTKWIRNNWKYEKAYKLNFDLAMITARMFNLPSTLAAIGQPRFILSDWLHISECELKHRKVKGLKIWNGAYIISTNGKKIDKLTYCMGLLKKVAANTQITKNCETLKETHTELMKVEGLASFLAAQVVADLKNSSGHPLQLAPDWNTFSAPGPGSLRGLEWFWKEKITRKNYQSKILGVYEILEFELPDSILKFLCMQNLQNCLCEYDKFMRVTNGTGRSKRKYNGGEINMYVINANGVNNALDNAIPFMISYGEELDSRNGKTLEIPAPVSTVYKEPWKRVLISKVRDANPFFHLMEAIWILAGRDDVKFLTEFNKRMGDYSDNGKTFNAPYGFRLRNYFLDEGRCTMDQLEVVIDILANDPNSRQAICQIWDTEDLERQTKDKACNMSIVFRIRKGKVCMTVYNRSNDMVWGLYGANMVQFSMIQEYVAAHLDLPIGTYTHVSNSFHVYLDGPGGNLWNKLCESFEYHSDPYNGLHNIVSMKYSDMIGFEHDLNLFFNIYDQFGIEEICEMNIWGSTYFKELILPVLYVHRKYKNEGITQARFNLTHIVSDDWRMACQQWLENRIK